ncbi:hypothetical protein HPG69_008714, partial [Diceros bicornis minor]
YCPEGNVMVTGSWNQLVKWRDPRTPCNVGPSSQPEEASTPSIWRNWLVVGTAGPRLWKRIFKDQRLKEYNIGQVYPVSAVSFHNIHNTLLRGVLMNFYPFIGMPFTVVPLAFSNEGTTLRRGMCDMYEIDDMGHPEDGVCML